MPLESPQVRTRSALSIAVICVLLTTIALAPASSPAAATTPSGEMTFECINGIDDDADGVSDAADAGCADDSPDTEDFTGPKTALSIADAREAALAEIGANYDSWEWRISRSPIKCHRVRPTKVTCTVSWIDWTEAVGARVTVYHYLDYDLKFEDTGTHMSAWSYSYACLFSKHPRRCGKHKFY